MVRKNNETPGLKEACIVAARDVIAEQGVEQLSLREVARKLGVSHQAPYRHYPSRDHLLAEVMRRCFQSFARALDARERRDDPKTDLESLGRTYLGYAQAHPLEYRLMFGTPWPQPAEHPDLVRDAVHAFDVLRGVLRRMYGEATATRSLVDLHAMFIWSTMHGFASISQANVMDCLELAPKVEAQASEHLMAMVDAAMQAGVGLPGAGRSTGTVAGKVAATAAVRAIGKSTGKMAREAAGRPTGKAIRKATAKATGKVAGKAAGRSTATRPGPVRER